MRRVVIERGPEGWRAPIRGLLDEGIPPEQVRLTDGTDAAGVLAFDAPTDAAPRPGARAPRAFFEAARRVACHADPDRYDLLYRLAWRLTHGAQGLLSDRADPDVARLRALDAAVRRDAHETTAFVRFRALADGSFAAWHGAEHDVLRLVGPFFADRFSDMRWMIVTPRESAAFDGEAVRYGEGSARRDAGVPDADAMDETWRAYYASIFNPARVNPKAMRTEMPIKHWRTLPEAALIPELVRTARESARRMQVAGPPDARAAAERADSLEALAEGLRSCEACALCRAATQAVPGVGSVGSVMLIGEQPGDEEDLAGRPFVGPAGGVLDAALRDAGVPRAALRLTNAVKHFRFTRRGKRRLHQRPTLEHVRACRPWLLREIELAAPRVIVTLGLTPTRALLGQTVRFDAVRGQVLESELGPRLLPTWHPAAALRASDPAERARIERELRDALARAYAMTSSSTASAASPSTSS